MEQPSLQAILAIVKSSVAREFLNLRPDDIYAKIAQGVNLPELNKEAARAGLGLNDPSQVTILAPFNVSGHRAMAYNDSDAIEYASNINAKHAKRFIGLTTHAATLNSPVILRATGVLTEVSWNWDVDKPIFLGRNGLLTQVTPSAEAGDLFSLVVATPKSPTSILVQHNEPIFLA